MRTTRTITATLAAAVAAAAVVGPVAAASPPQPKPQRAGAAILGTAVNSRNTPATTVWVAFMRYDPAGCGADGNWQTKGWVRLNPGEVKQAFTTSNRYAYYYAHAADGTKWSGEGEPVRSKPIYIYR